MGREPGGAPMGEYCFTLYVAGDSELGSRALSNFERLVRGRLRDRCTLTTVDILKEPGLARRNRVVATPLLVRERPAPVVKVLGDLSQEAKILIQLGLDEDAEPPSDPA
ncbi:MAG: circadian clock KaiB family protein [Isosphaeraceae bacterium]